MKEILSMTISLPTGTTRTVELADDLTITLTTYGDAGRTVLMLHGGGGPATVAGFAAALADEATVLTPTHPGFDGEPRPDRLDSVADLATVYLDPLDTLDLRDVLVIGSSVGGWIAAEMAVRDNHRRIAGLVLVDGVGILARDPAEIADVAKVGPAEFFRRAWHNPALRPDPAAQTEQQRAAFAANQRTLMVYAGDPYCHDPKLRGRLHRVTVPVLLAWGEQDGVAPVDYGRAYAESFPNARFELIAEAGHLPHIEQPERTRELVAGFARTALV
jgi:pimeloyl-ACP methyl ester carboxylesterase